MPAQGQTPQTFETSADILAKPTGTRLPVQTGIPWMPQTNDVSVYLTGTATQLQPGDAILIVGDERLNNSADNPLGPSHRDCGGDRHRPRRTLCDLGRGPGRAGGVGPTRKNPKFYALRQRASLFGYNAVNPLMLTPKTRTGLGGPAERRMSGISARHPTGPSFGRRACSIWTRFIRSWRWAAGWR